MTTASTTADTQSKPRLRGFALISVMIALMLTLFLEALDQTIVGTAMPRIVEALHGLDRYLMTASPQNVSETLAAGVHPSSEQQQKTDGGEHASKWAVLSIVAAGVFMATGRVVGQSVSVALAGSMLVARPHVPVAQLSSLQEAFVSSFHATFLACAAIAALGIATSLVRGKERGKER